MKLAIDTNVTISANGRDTHAEAECQLRCIDLLSEIASGRNGSKVVLDELGLIITEYTPYLYHRGQPGVGDMFFKYLHDNMHNENLIELVSITPVQDEDRAFEELPPNKMDRSDQKFLAVAVKSGATIVNALDTDWKEQEDLMKELKVEVRQICPEHGCLI